MIYLVRRQRESKQGVFYLLLCFPNGCIGQDRATLKPGDRHSIWVSHIAGGREAQILPFQAHQQKAASEVEFLIKPLFWYCATSGSLSFWLQCEYYYGKMHVKNDSSRGWHCGIVG